MLMPGIQKDKKDTTKAKRFLYLCTDMKTMTETDYIHKRIAEGEHLHQDFKFAISDARKIARSLSAFANTEGGCLLVGVKDNGRIAGVRSEEEIYMVQAAAQLYCHPAVEISTHIYKVEGRDILEVSVPEVTNKPVCALDEVRKPWAYVRIADENILATPVHLAIWKHNRAEREVMMTYTERERLLLDILSLHAPLTLNQCTRLAHLSRRETCLLLADFIRFGLVEASFADHTFYFHLCDKVSPDK